MQALFDLGLVIHQNLQVLLHQYSHLVLSWVLSEHPVEYFKGTLCTEGRLDDTIELEAPGEVLGEGLLDHECDAAEFGELDGLVGGADGAGEASVALALGGPDLVLRPLVDHREELVEEDAQVVRLALRARVHRRHYALQYLRQHVQKVEVRHLLGVQHLQEMDGVEGILWREEYACEEAVLDEHGGDVGELLLVDAFEAGVDVSLEEQVDLLGLLETTDLLLLELLLLLLQFLSLALLLARTHVINLLLNLFDLVRVYPLRHQHRLQVQVPEDGVELGVEGEPEVLTGEVLEVTALVKVLIHLGALSRHSQDLLLQM